METRKTTITVKLKPRASRDSITVTGRNEVVISVTSPPVDGEANDHLIAFLAKKLKVAKSSCSIKTGLKSKHKVVEIKGIGPEEVATRLGS